MRWVTEVIYRFQLDAMTTMDDAMINVCEAADAITACFVPQ